ncbi:hypothetical protein, partial [Streptomyces sp. NPDC001494]
IIDTAWENAPAGETFSCVLSVYFTFEDDGRDGGGAAVPCGPAGVRDPRPPPVPLRAGEQGWKAG